MNKDYLKALYGGERTKPSDQETREEYEARRKAKKKKKSEKEPSSTKVLQTEIKIVDADSEFYQPNVNDNRADEPSAVGNSSPKANVDNKLIQAKPRRPRVDSSSSDEDRNALQRVDVDGDVVVRRRRARVDSSSSSEEEETSKKKVQLDADGDILVKRRSRVDSSSSSDESSKPKVDADGDIEFSSKRRRRSSSTASSSSSSDSDDDDNKPTAIGLKTREEFAMSQRSKRVELDEEDEYALGKGQSTVYRDKVTREIKEVQARTRRDIEQEDRLLNFELNMGALDKLALKGVPLEKNTEQEALNEDPMARFLKKDKEVVDLTITGKPKYKGPKPPPNRFGIPPGYRWDGVDRSNKFEARLLRSRSERMAT